MKYRTLGKTGYSVSEISFGAWAIGGTWGEVNDKTSLEALETAVQRGVNFIDTADVYGDGRSEKLIGQLIKKADHKIYVATKAGRRLNPHTADGYNRKNLTEFIERSLHNLNVECLDLLQLHCPPTDVYPREDVYGILDDLKKEGKIAHYGVSVEKVDEALEAIQHEGVATVQIIFNMFRHKPAEVFFRKAVEQDVGIIARVPLASGLLTGKMSEHSTFDRNDHRVFNRNGEAFDKGETFSGVDYHEALDVIEELKATLPKGIPLSQIALKWILMHDAVSCAIPGAKTPQQVVTNVSASDYPTLSLGYMQFVQELYREHLKASVHHLW